MVLWDGTSPVNWAYKGEMTAEEIGQTDQYKHMLEVPTVLFESDGKVYDFRYLSILVDAYATYDDGGNPSIDISDPEAALRAVIEAMNKPNPTPEQRLADQQAQIDEQAAAIEELITMQLEGAE